MDAEKLHHGTAKRTLRAIPWFDPSFAGNGSNLAQPAAPISCRRPWKIPRPTFAGPMPRKVRPRAHGIWASHTWSQDGQGGQSMVIAVVAD